MKGPLAVVAAGGTFAVTVIVALAVAIWAGGREHPAYILIGLAAGVLIGGYSAYRLVASALSG